MFWQRACICTSSAPTAVSIISIGILIINLQLGFLFVCITIAHVNSAPSENIKPIRSNLASNPRYIAIYILENLFQHRISLKQQFDSDLTAKLSSEDRGLVKAITHETLRNLSGIDSAIALFLKKPLPPKNHDIQNILRIALAQLFVLKIADYAVVDSAVKLAENMGRAPLKAMVNGVLRSAIRERDRVHKALQAKPRSNWFTKKLGDDYGKAIAHEIMLASRAMPDLDITTAGDATALYRKFLDAGINGVVTAERQLRIPAVSQVSMLPEFAASENVYRWWVQEYSASLPARIMASFFAENRSRDSESPLLGLKILDLCAAPGGKTAQLVGYGAEVTALDSSHIRLLRLMENMERLKMRVETVNADATIWRSPQLFDAILLDAPCTASGTLRRNPDIPYTKCLEDIDELSEIQFKIAVNALYSLKPGGVILYSTCSLFKQEGEEVVQRLLEENPQLRRIPITINRHGLHKNLINERGELRVTHQSDEVSNVDGFFSALLGLGG
jgi:16S rRNA (cytosine967-C5)-methyltransferase